ncbi:MAG: hypothetical protein HQK53_03085 [Oligoflexia bacterium]|nr:hypothetical protein [Oligoflexia bacterium]
MHIKFKRIKKYFFIAFSLTLLSNISFASNYTRVSAGVISAKNQAKLRISNTYSKDLMCKYTLSVIVKNYTNNTGIITPQTEETLVKAGRQTIFTASLENDVNQFRTDMEDNTYQLFSINEERTEEECRLANPSDSPQPTPNPGPSTGETSTTNVSVSAIIQSDSTTPTSPRQKLFIKVKSNENYPVICRSIIIRAEIVDDQNNVIGQYPVQIRDVRLLSQQHEGQTDVSNVLKEYLSSVPKWQISRIDMNSIEKDCTRLKLPVFKSYRSSTKHCNDINNSTEMDSGVVTPEGDVLFSFWCNGSGDGAAIIRLDKNGRKVLELPLKYNNKFLKQPAIALTANSDIVAIGNQEVAVENHKYKQIDILQRISPSGVVNFSQVLPSSCEDCRTFDYHFFELINGDILIAFTTMKNRSQPNPKYILTVVKTDRFGNLKFRDEYPGLNQMVKIVQLRGGGGYIVATPNYTSGAPLLQFDANGMVYEKQITVPYYSGINYSLDAAISADEKKLVVLGYGRENNSGQMIMFNLDNGQVLWRQSFPDIFANTASVLFLPNQEIAVSHLKSSNRTALISFFDNNGNLLRGSIDFLALIYGENIEERNSEVKGAYSRIALWKNNLITYGVFRGGYGDLLWGKLTLNGEIISE